MVRILKFFVNYYVNSNLGISWNWPASYTEGAYLIKIELRQSHFQVLPH